MIHKIRKGQVRWVKKGDVLAQNQFIDRVFGSLSQLVSYAPPSESLLVSSPVFATHPFRDEGVSLVVGGERRLK